LNVTFKRSSRINVTLMRNKTAGPRVPGDATPPAIPLERHVQAV
jgi:hypothetical protein